ncbi:MAG TPA: prepilin-type N-terminal cleavage/methylation domain-containing protein [Pyrinomonadaceae bacterium]|nr:prepilin-type N-terminal cleavage/methylation domain-containing protein [Pyrinomonadaceae bacterium]
MQQAAPALNKEAGFSLMELLVAMTVMVFITGAAASLLVSAFNVRTREDQRSEGTADARRALNIISREVASAGYQLPSGLTYAAPGGTKPVPPNGLIAEDCNATSITFVTNTNAQGDFDQNPNDAIPDEDPNFEISGSDEAVKFQFVQDGASNFLVRKDLVTGDSLVLANRIDGVQFDFLNPAGGTAATIAQATSINIRLWVTLNQVGRPGSAGYQAPSQVTLTSRVNLRNAQLGTF